MPLSIFSEISKYFSRNMSTSLVEDITISPSDGTTGSILCGCYVPEEIVTKILSYIDPPHLLQCRNVCKYWRTVIDNEVWKLKIRKEQCRSLNEAILINTLPIPWIDFYWLCNKNPIGRNLLKNHSGQEKFKRWKILSNGGNKWAVENPPIGADPLPAANDFCETFCYATSFHSCSMEQTVDLKSEGLTQHFMDKMQPNIVVSEWFAGRFDCGCIYEMKVRLLDEKLKKIEEFDYRETVKQWEGKKWNKVQHTFEGYGPGVRYVVFYHGGMDTQLWAGHYGSKMAGASIKVIVRPREEETST